MSRVANNRSERATRARARACGSSRGASKFRARSRAVAGETPRDVAADARDSRPPSLARLGKVHSGPPPSCLLCVLTFGGKSTSVVRPGTGVPGVRARCIRSRLPTSGGESRGDRPGGRSRILSFVPPFLFLCHLLPPPPSAVCVRWYAAGD